MFLRKVYENAQGTSELRRQSSMQTELSRLQSVLLQGIRLSQQTSYNRRNPCEAALPFLDEARRGLTNLVKDGPENAAAWRLLSQAEECLLNYDESIRCLNAAMALAPTPDRKDLKRLAALQQHSKQWKDLHLSPAMLQDLRGFLAEAGADSEARGRTLRFTKQWLAERAVADPESVLAALERRGAFTDFQVFYNVARG
jgi:tetratricopeptide (TPR) repeat protein